DLYFAMDEKSHDADLTEKGRNFLSPKDPNAFVLPDLTTIFHEIDAGPEADARKRLEMKAKIQAEFEARAQQIHCIAQLLKAYCLYLKDVQYVVQENKVIIVDENTGRLMTGRRWSDGLHQAVEAKEGVEIERETQTLATITIQNYFRLYRKLAGMTGTAETDAQEFFDIYKLGVLVIPTNKPVARKDANDSVYKTRREKYSAVLGEIQQVHAQGRPILVGTISVEVSELLSRMLKKEGIIHSVLNAKYHQQEAEIVTRAGQRGSVTIATNMAGRGTDIKLGVGVPDSGGLHVIGTERHEAIYGFRNEIIHATDVRDRLMDIMEEVVIQKVEEFTTSETDFSEWKLRALSDWVNLNFPLGMPEGEITKAAEAGQETPVAG